jgi:hypothetical protein
MSSGISEISAHHINRATRPSTDHRRLVTPMQCDPIRKQSRWSIDHSSSPKTWRVAVKIAKEEGIPWRRFMAFSELYHTAIFHGYLLILRSVQSSLKTCHPWFYSLHQTHTNLMVPHLWYLFDSSESDCYRPPPIRAAENEPNSTQTRNKIEKWIFSHFYCTQRPQPNRNPDIQLLRPLKSQH